MENKYLLEITHFFIIAIGHLSDVKSLTDRSRAVYQQKDIHYLDTNK